MLTLLEIAIKSLRRGRPEVADAYGALIGDITNLSKGDRRGCAGRFCMTWQKARCSICGQWEYDAGRSQMSRERLMLRLRDCDRLRCGPV